VGEETVARGENLRKVLITGANGFIGSWIVRALVDRGHPARAFVLPNADLRNLEDCRGRIEIVTGDILDLDSLHRAMEGCRAVIHTAGSILTHPRDGERAWQMHYAGAVNVFDAARAANLERIVHTASIFTLGAGWKDQPADEAHAKPFAPRNFRYYDAKVAAQKLAEERCAAGLPIVFVYPTFCFGPGDIHLSSSGQLVDYLRGRLPGVTDTGINVVDVRDAALGHVLALERGRIGEKYLLAGADVTFRDLFARAGEIAGRTLRVRVFPRWLMLPTGWVIEKVIRQPPLDFATAQVAQEFWYYRSDKAARELGLAVRPLDATLRDAVAWFRTQGMI
jgi:dihydroflavonol-4-reductase